MALLLHYFSATIPMKTFAAVVIASMAALVSGRCPKPASIQSDYVKEHFDIKKMEGTYYELAYHDYTQPKGVCDCMRSRKWYVESEKRLYDDFSLRCGPHKGNDQQWMNHMFFDETDEAGVISGTWDRVNFIKFPDTIVDVGVKVGADGKEYYDWALEFQCTEIISQPTFYGVNLYSRENVSKTNLDAMMASAEKYGILPYMKGGLGITYLDHTNCTYPADELPRDDKAAGFKNFKIMD